MPIVSRRSLLATAAAGIALAPTWAREAIAQALPARNRLVLNDASRLNPVPVAHSILVQSASEERTIAELRSLLKEAARAGRPLAVGGARHSMGGQSLARDGFAVALGATACVPNTTARTYRVQAGARWRDVIRTLDPLGFSPAVMQSNNDFTVGGTLSVNAHGWPVAFGPFASTVRSFRLMLADGSLLTCSRTENAELFGLAAGGYGLFGIVLDAEVEMVDNALLTPGFEVVAADKLAQRFAATATDPAVRMAYGRLSVARAGFLEQGIIGAYRPGAPRANLPEARRSGAYSFVSRQLFRAQIGSERGKRARWYAETVLLPKAAGSRAVTRNAILSYPASVLAETSPKRTDILHEYFLPPERFADFLKASRERIPLVQDLLNVTLRYVDADPLSMLSFAPRPRIAAVMLFNQPATDAADDAARAMTEGLIDAALSLGGSYYLPYRLHGRPEQLKAAYPQLDVFAAKKRHYDPQLRFRNLFWDRYLG